MNILMKPNDMFHSFSKKEITIIQDRLLHEWYAKHQRILPWRNLPSEITDQNRAYRVLVSEIMLQQTQVSVVISYYNSWISRWPTLESLSSATLEQVQTEWKGLGYNSRARRLLSIAQQSEKLPVTAAELSKLSGIGPYTAGAVASIVFNERIPAVDGNVTRVLCRLRSIGGAPLIYPTKNAIVEIASALVPEDSPGDWNQAVIELGATVCTPRQPDCQNCPVNAFCQSYQSNVHDIEGCLLCLPADKQTATPLSFPWKEGKEPAGKEYHVVCIVDINGSYFLVKRDSSGLLADLWQFPSFPIPKDLSGSRLAPRVKAFMKKNCSLTGKLSYKWIQDVQHKFSHIDMTYKVVVIEIKTPQNLTFPSACCSKAWVTAEEFNTLPVSTAMRKVFNACNEK